ncbi:MAG: uroporphyrinogen decarboxylase family protein [Anaerolineae bacterium]
MKHRERFHATMHYEARDRVPLIDFGFWDETLDVWHEQGLPAYVDRTNIHDYLGMDYDFSQVTFATGTDAGLVPPFEEQVLEDRGEQEVVQQADGVRVLRSKRMGSIPQHLGHLLVDRESWEKHYKPRLDPAHPDRMPPDLATRVETWADPEHDEITVPWVGGLYGWLRDWMGLEKISLVMYEDPAWFDEMIGTVADCIIGTLDRLLGTGAKVDGCALWEDMCYKGGPLMSPKKFKQHIVPHYQRITALLRDYGVDTIWVDSDGKIDLLIPHWLDSGINCVLPLEVGTWKTDPIEYRQRYGKELRMFGGFDKRILAGNKDSIEREVHRLTPLVEEGGYIPFCDHLVPPDVTFENYLFYLELARTIWCKSIELHPQGLARPSTGGDIPQVD